MPDLCPKGIDLGVKPSAPSCPLTLPPYLGLQVEQRELKARETLPQEGLPLSQWKPKLRFKLPWSQWKSKLRFKLPTYRSKQLLSQYLATYLIKGIVASLTYAVG